MEANLRTGDAKTLPFLLPIGPLAKRALVAAVLEAGRFGSPAVHTHHLLIALAEDDGSIASMALAWAKLSPDRLRDAARSYLAAGGEAPHEGGEGIKPISSRALRRPSVQAARLALTIDKINASIEWSERLQRGRRGQLR